MTLKENACNSILDTIGQTPVVRVNHIGRGLPAALYVKCEYMNPGGSTKDRIARYMIDAAEREGQLKPGGTIVEATSGNTGIGVAMVAAVRGYRCIFVLADKQSEEKRNALRATGAEVVVCPTDVAAEDPRSYYEVARRIAKETPNSFLVNQYNNPTNPESHYASTGPEIWKQCGEDLDAVVIAIGTGGSVCGISRYLKERKPEIQIIGVDPVGSIFFELFHTKKAPVPHTYLVEGIGEDFMPAAMNLAYMDDIVQVTDKECFLMARRLVREEGVYAGGSSGAAMAGAVKYVQTHMEKFKQRRPNILVVLPDSWTRYQSKCFNDGWMKEKGFI